MTSVEPNEFETRRQLLQMEMLYEIGVALSESLDLRQVAQEILNRALVMVDARGGLLLIKDQDEGPLKPIADLGLAGEGDELGQLLQLDSLGEAWRRNEVRQEQGGLSAGRSLCFVPLASRGEVRGLLVVADKEHRAGQTGPFDENDLRLLHSFAHQAGAALQNARLHDQLRHTYEELKAAQARLAQVEQLRALGTMAAEVAHELNHILTSIMGCADVFLTFGKDPKEAMASILSAAEQGTEIVQRIQRFTQLDVGRHRSTVDLADLLREAVSQTRSTWAQRASQDQSAIDWCLQVHPLPLIQANATELHEVCTNLLLNALEAMPQGGQLQIEARPAPPGVVVEIRDTGVGIPPEHQKRIFSPFYSTKDGAGRGLGLSIAYRIVHAHGGSLSLVNLPGQGACFRIGLPLQVGAAAASGSEEDVEAYLGG